MKIILFPLLISILGFTTEATLIKKLVAAVAPSAVAQVHHSEPQLIASHPLPLEPAPVYENTGDIHPALLPPPSIFSIQPVTRYVVLPPTLLARSHVSTNVLPHPYYHVLHADTSAGLLFHPGYESAVRYAASSGEIHNQHLLDYAAAQAQSNAITQSQYPQGAFSIAGSNAAATAVNQQNTFRPQQYGFRDANAFAQSNTAVSNVQDQQSQYELPLGDLSQQNNFNSALNQQSLNTLAASSGLQSQQSQFGSTLGDLNQQNNFGLNQQALVTSSGQTPQLFSPALQSGPSQQLFSPHSATSSVASSSASSQAHSTSVSTNGVSTNGLSSFTSSSSSASSALATSASGANVISPYTIPAAASSSNAAASLANVADNLIVPPNASYGPPQ